MNSNGLDSRGEEPFSFEFEVQLGQNASDGALHTEHVAHETLKLKEEGQADGLGSFHGGFRRPPPMREMEFLEFDGSTAESPHASGNPKKRFKATHQVVCRHWLRGMCIKADMCDFLHIFDNSRMPLCRNFRRHGFCAENDIGVCPLRHEDDGSQFFGEFKGGEAADDNAESTGLKPEHERGRSFGGKKGRDRHANVNSQEDEQRQICLRYLFGFCSAGPACHQEHIPLKAEDLIDAPVPDWYLHLVLAPTSDGSSSSKDDGGEGISSNAMEFPFPPLSVWDRQQSSIRWQEVAEKWMGGRKSTFVNAGKRTLEDLLPDRSLCIHGRSKSFIRSQGADAEPLKVRVFVIKSGKIENILTSVQKGIWATGRANIEKLESAFKTCDHVLFLMSANESGGFQGYARMASLPDPALYPRIWGYFSLKLSPNFRVHWIKQCKLDFEMLSTFTNPWNCNKPLKKSRDGQEMPLDLAEAICLRLDAAPSENLLADTPLEFLPRIDHDKFFDLSPEDQLREEVRLGFRFPSGATNSGTKTDGCSPVRRPALHAPPPPPPPPISRTDALPVNSIDVTQPPPPPLIETDSNSRPPCGATAAVVAAAAPECSKPISHPVQHLTVMTGYRPVVPNAQQQYHR